MRKFEPITEQQLAAADLKMEGLSDAAIARKLDIPGGAVAVKKALNAPAMNHYMSKYLDDAGATYEASAKAIAEAHGAMETKFVTFNGEITDRVNVVDHNTRLSAAELNYRLRGDLRESSAAANIFVGMTDAQVAAIASGQIDPATLIDVGPRIDNPALDKPEP